MSVVMLGTGVKGSWFGAVARVLVGAAVVALAASGCGSHPYMPLRIPAPTMAAAAPGFVGTHADGKIVGAHDTELYLQSWRPAGPPRAVLVLVHGLKDHGARYRQLAERLAARGVATYAADLRGHAHSAGDRVYVDSFDDYLDDLGRVIAEARRREGPGPRLFLFGHSMGGAIVTSYLIKRKPDVAGVVLTGAALDVDAGWVKLQGIKVMAAIAPGAGVFDLNADDFSRDPAVVAETKTDPLIFQPAASAHLARELVREIHAIRDNMGQITAPLFIAHGGADKITPPSGSRDLYARAASKDKTLKIYDGDYHDLSHEPNRDVVLGDIVGWIDARAGAAVASTPN
jgi:alpha-beta hydrolase superfamily lysophospholipase